MEARVARLEASVSHIERDIAELRADMREVRTEMQGMREGLADLKSILVRVDERLAHVPTTWKLVLGYLGVALTVAAVIVAAAGIR